MRKKDEDGEYQYHLKEEATRNRIAFSAPETQDDCALFYQTIAVLHNGKFNDYGVVEDLKDIIVYVDFSNIFDRRSSQKKYVERIDPDTALKCAVALKKRDFAMDVLLDRIADNAVKG